jgi:hypothetical protein
MQSSARRLRRDPWLIAARTIGRAEQSCAVGSDDAVKASCDDAVALEVVMFRNHRIPSKVVLAVLVMIGADIGSAHAQGARPLKVAKDRFAPGLEKLGPGLQWLGSEASEFAAWLRPKWRLVDEKVEERATLQEKLSETTAAAEAELAPNARALANARQLAAIDAQAKIMQSWIDDARAQIVADLQKRADASEGEVAAIFESHIRAAAQKSASPPVEIVLAKLTIKFVYSVDFGPVRITPGEIDLRPIVKGALKTAVPAYIACRAGQNVNDRLKSAASGYAAARADSEKAEDCASATLDLLEKTVRRALTIETDREVMARAAERGD